MFNTTKLFSSFSVSDMAKAKAFYEQVLNLDVSDNDMGIMVIQIKTGSKIIVYPKEKHTPAGYTILNFPVNDIEKAVDFLISKGIVFEQYEGETKTDAKGICRNAYGPPIAWFKDPSGNILSVLEDTQ